MSVEQRAQPLKEDHAAVAKVWGEHPREEAKRTMAAIYARLRGVLERLVREIIFKKAIRPLTPSDLATDVGASKAARISRLPGLFKRWAD